MTMITDERCVRLRTHRSNISRYRSLLKTELTGFERQVLERRLSEERSAMACLASSAFPRTLKIPMAVEGGPKAR